MASTEPARWPVAEIFGPTIQGEGRDIGRLCHFIRFGGCDYRCSWCDSLHAVDPESVRALPKMTTVQIVDELYGLYPVDYVVLTGGNPAMYDLSELARKLKSLNAKVAVETQGTIYNEWLQLADLVTISPKPPSSGMPDTRDNRLSRFIANFSDRKRLVLKVVVFDDRDIEWALAVHKDFPDIEFFLSIGTVAGNTHPEDLLAETRRVISIVTRFHQEVGDIKILPQFHVLLWGNELGR